VLLLFRNAGDVECSMVKMNRVPSQNKRGEMGVCIENWGRGDKNATI
jgi:hypothetical protein